MKKMIVVMAISLVVALLAGCSGDTDEPEVRLGEEAVLKPQQNLTVKGEDIEIRFIGVTADSRCPKGASCIWEGEATCAIEITAASASRTETLVQSGADEVAETFIEGYTFRFRLEPYPERNREIISSEYRLVLTIEKG